MPRKAVRTSTPNLPVKGALNFTVNINPNLYPVTTINGPSPFAIDEAIPGFFGERFMGAGTTETPTMHTHTAQPAGTTGHIRKPMAEATKKKLRLAAAERKAAILAQGGNVPIPAKSHKRKLKTMAATA